MAPHTKLPPLPPEALADERAIAAAATKAVDRARAGDIRGGLALALQAHRQAQGLALPSGELAALNAAATVHGIRGDLMAAVAAGIDACVLARKLGARAIHGHALVTIATSAFRLGILPQAKTYLEECLERAREEGDARLEARARIALGIVLGDSGNFDAAAVQVARAFLLVRQSGDSTSPARVITNLANVHRKRAAALALAGDRERLELECEEAESLAWKALESARGEGNLAVQVDAFAIRAQTCALRGDSRWAAEHFGSAVRAARETGLSAPLAMALAGLGRSRLGLGDVQGALEAWREAHEVASALRPSERIAEACRGLAEVHARAGDELGERRWRERAAAESAEFSHACDQTRAQLRAFLIP